MNRLVVIFAIASLMATSNSARAQSGYSFGSEVQSTSSASTTYSSNNQQFQYYDAANTTDDYAFLPLTGVSNGTDNAATVVNTSTGWYAALNITLPSTNLTSSSGQVPHIGMGLELGFGSGGHTYSVSVTLNQYNNSGGAATSNYPANAYGTSACLTATTDNVNQATTVSGVDNTLLFNGISVLSLSNVTSNSAGFQQVNTATGVLVLAYNSSTNTVTGYYNGIPIGSYSLSSWGTNPSVGLGVLGFSGEGATLYTGYDTAYNFYASNTAPPDVGNYDLQKGIQYDQSSAAAPVLDVTPYQFYCSVSPGTSGALFPNVSLTTPPGGASSPTFTYNQQGSQVNQFFATKAALDAAYPSGTGTYTLSVQTNTPNNYVDGMTFGTDNYPDTPQITTLVNAYWNNGVLEIPDVSKDVTITWNNTTGASANLNINGNYGGAYYNSSYNSGGSTTQYVIPGNTLYDGQEYSGEIDLNNNGGPGTSDTHTIAGYGGPNFQKRVTFIVQTGSGNVSTSPIYNAVVKSHIVVQNSANAPVDGSGIVNNSDAAPYNLSIQSAASGTVTLSGTSTNFPLAFDSSGGNNTGDYEFASGPVTTLGTLNAIAPNGTYNFPGNISITLAGSTYPAAAQITLVNGNPPVWDAQGELVLDPTINNVITWAPVSPANYVNENVNFSATNGGNFNSINASYGPIGTISGTTNALFISNETMTPGSTYVGSISYASSPGGFTTSSTGSSTIYDVGGYQTQTDFTAIAKYPYGLLQAIEFPQIAPLSSGAPPFTLNATASSNLPVTYSIVSGQSVATLSGTNNSIVTLTGSAGYVQIKASQSGNSTYSPAIDSFQTFSVGLASQTINFPGTNYDQLLNSSITFDATATSGLPVTYLVTPPSGSPYTLSGNSLVFSSPGNYTVEAQQAGDGTNWAAATPVPQYFYVSATLPDVGYYQIQKLANYDQTGSGAVTLDPSTPYQFSSFISQGQTGTVLASTTLTPPPGSTGTVTYQSQVASNGNLTGNTGLQFGESFSSLAALDAAFVGGTYNLNIQTSTPSTYDAPLSLGTGSANYPVIPQITGVTYVKNSVTSNATWSNGLVQIPDGTDSVTITFNNPGNLYFYYNINNIGYNNVTSTSTTITIPTSGNLQDDTTYGGNITLEHQTDSESIDNNTVFGDAEYDSQVNFGIAIGTGANLSNGDTNNFYDIQKEHVLIQNSNSNPVDLVGNNNALEPGPYNVKIESPTTLTGTVAGPNSTQFPLIYTSYDGQYEYHGGPVASAAALTAIAPTGTYTITGSGTIGAIKVNLFGVGGVGTDTYLGAAKVTQVNGALPVWDAQGRLVLDPSVDNTIAFSGPTMANLSNPNGAGYGFQQIRFQDQDGNSIVNEEDAGASSDSGTITTAYTTLPIPSVSGTSTTLTAGSSYILQMQYAQISNGHFGNPNSAAFYQTSTNVLVVAGKPQTLTFGSIPTQQYGTALTLTATATSGLSPQYTVISGAASLSGSNTLIFTGTGTVTIQASQPGDATYASAINLSQTFTVNKAPLTVGVNSGGHSTYGATPVDPGIAVVSGTLANADTLARIGLGDNIATLTSTSPVGSHTLSVTGALSVANYTVTTVSATYTINQDPITVAVNSGVHSTYGTTPFDPGITLVSGTLVNGNSLSSIGLGDNFNLTANSNAGVYTLTVTGSASATNYLVTTESGTFTVNKAPLTVAVNAGLQSTYGTTPTNPGLIIISGTLAPGDSLASIGLGDSFNLTDTSSAGPYTLNVTGTATILNYNVATQSGTFTINKAPITVAVNSGGQSTYGTTPVDPGITVTAGSLAPGDTPTSIGLGDNIGTLLSSASNSGTYTLSVTGAGSAANYIVTSQTATYTIVPASQTITFPTIPAQTYPGPTVTLGATASSGLPVNYTTVPITGPATLTGSNTLSLTGTGSVSVTASQPGDLNHLAAANQTQSFNVTASPNLTYTQWATSYGISGETPGASHLNDGVSNLLKYVYDIVPTTPMSVGDKLKLATVVTTSSTQTLTYNKNGLIDPLATLQVQFSSDLKNWTTVTSMNGTITTTAASGNDTTVSTEVPLSTSKQFIRLYVTTPIPGGP